MRNLIQQFIASISFIILDQHQCSLFGPYTHTGNMPSIILHRSIRSFLSANIANKHRQNESLYYRSYIDLLRSLFGRNFAIAPEYHIGESRESIDLVLLGTDDSPILFIEVNSPHNSQDNFRRQDTDTQTTQVHQGTSTGRN